MSKESAEIAFWKSEWEGRIRWFRGECKTGERYGTRCPKPHERFTHCGSEDLDALATWHWFERYRYCHHLMIPPVYFRGRNVLDVGCGPISPAAFLLCATMTGIDPAMDDYDEIGYPSVIEAECEPSEQMPFVDGEFHAVISVNALDHVSSFEDTIAEIERVVRPDGEIRIECHYHRATETEPIELNDERVRAAFRKFDVQPISRLPSSAFYPPGTHPAEDQFVLWSNRPYKFNALEGLK